MTENRKSTGFAEKLSEEQHIQLCEWLGNKSHEEAAELVAKEAPEGFGITVSRATIGRFARAHSDEIADLRSQRIEAALGDYQDAHSHQDIYFASEVDDATTSALREQAFLLSLQPNLSSTELQRLARTCLALRELQTSQPNKGTILLAKQSADQLNARVRIEIAKRFEVSDPNNQLPVESKLAEEAWMLRRIKSMEKDSPETDQAQQNAA